MYNFTVNFKIFKLLPKPNKLLLPSAQMSIKVIVLQVLLLTQHFLSID